MSRFYILFIVSFIKLISVHAQERDVEIANEYFELGEYSKAGSMYERLSKNSENLPFIYKNYVATLLYFKQKDEAEKFIRKMIKSTDDNLGYKLDHYILATEINGAEKTEKEFSSIVNEVKMNEALTEKTSDFFVKKNRHENALQLLLASRKALKNNSLYTIPAAAIYYKQGQVEMAIDELLSFPKNNPTEIENIRNTFQNILTEEKDFEILETKLYTYIQTDPNDISYNELLLWLNLQKKNFNKAFMQARAIDKRNKMQGLKMMDVGKIAMDNKDYAAASRFYEYVVNEYPKGINYPVAKRELIHAKEETVKNSFPVDSLQIRSLVNDYSGMISELGNNSATIEARRNMAMLYAFYLNNKDTAIAILNYAIEQARNDIRVRSKIKIDLGDLCLLKGEPWESTLLYSQVEKDMKEDPLGHEAKLRNAKLSYYKGEFDLAQAHLDVLKLATSREISNDAIELSILIQDNTGLDSTTDAMKDYAAIDLLLFQNKINEAFERTDALLKKYPYHTLTDELFWLKGRILRKMGDYNSAITELEKIVALYPTDILGDNALYTIGNIYEENMKDQPKAMETYQKFMMEYPGSIFIADARKRFRLLRGDKL